MATGYDNRQGGRSSFAFEPAKPSQSQSAQASGFRGIQMDGGNTSVAGGISAASNFTEAGPSAGALGGFFTELLAPAIKRRQDELFVKGMVDQMSAVSGEEIRDNNKNPINQIFGPSSYEEGAIAYSAKDAVNQWQSKTLQDMDRLKRLPPDQLSKVVAESFQTMMTGDKFTDTVVSTSLIEASQPVIGAIAKERYSWQQSEALNAKTKADFSNAEAFQAAMTSLAKTGSPSDAGNLAANAARNNFMSSLVQPSGMDDETYRKSLVTLYKRSAQAGNGYAVSMLKNQPGFFNLLSDEEIVKLEDTELKYGNRALSRAAINHAEDIDRLNYNMEFGKISSTEAMAQMANINESVKSETGFDIDLFDYKDVTGAGKNVWGALHASLNRQQDRQWQVEDMATRQRFELEKADKEAQDEAAQVQLAYASGNIKTAQAQGIGAGGNYDVLAQADYAQGNWTNMIRNYNKDGWVSGLVKDQVQAQITSSIGQEYNKDFQQGYEKFTALNKAKPAAAMGYYGDLYAPMLAYERMVTTGRVTPTQAFARAFANPAQYAPVPEMTKAAKDKISSWIDSNRGRGMIVGSLVGRGGLTSSGKSALNNAMSRQLGVMMKNTDMPVEALIPNLYQDLVSSGAYEDYGRLGWSNKPGTPNLGRSLGLMPDEADEVVESTIDAALKATGFKDGVKGDNFDVRRIKDQSGQMVLAVTPYDDDEGAGTTALIPFSKFKAKADGLRDSRVSRAKPNWGKNLDPYRRIKGESGFARIKRINQEVSAGASPTNRNITGKVLGYSKAPVDKSNWAKRADGSTKGTGWLGLLKRPDGNVSSEISVGVEIRGKETEIPLMVPGLTKSELDYLMTNNPEGKTFLSKMPPSIMNKAVAHAHKQITAGKSPFK